MKQLYRLSFLVLPLLVIFLLVTPVQAITPTSCPTSTCPSGQKFWIDTACQQKRLVDGPDVASCCLYYCAAQPDSRTGSSSVSIPINPFPTTIKLDTPQGIATLVATLVEMFLGVVAMYAVYIAVRSALLLAQADNADAAAQARKNMTSAVIGLVICGTALGGLQIIINLLGLGSINDLFNAIGAVLRGGR